MSGNADPQNHIASTEGSPPSSKGTSMYTELENIGIDAEMLLLLRKSLQKESDILAIPTNRRMTRRLSKSISDLINSVEHVENKDGFNRALYRQNAFFSEPSIAEVPSYSKNKKRIQVKNACVNCQKACKKCDDTKPCLRCIKKGIQETCKDSSRKIRQKGLRRGSYKRKSDSLSVGEESKMEDLQDLNMTIEVEPVPIPVPVPAQSPVPKSKNTPKEHAHHPSYSNFSTSMMISILNRPRTTTPIAGGKTSEFVGKYGNFSSPRKTAQFSFQKEGVLALPSSSLRGLETTPLHSELLKTPTPKENLPVHSPFPSSIFSGMKNSKRRRSSTGTLAIRESFFQPNLKLHELSDLCTMVMEKEAD